MDSINRQIAIIKPKTPYIDWINSLSETDQGYESESLQEDCTAILLPHFDDDNGSVKFIKKIYQRIFELELEGWTTNKNKWPKKRTYALFCKWFKIEFHSEVFDFGKGAIEIDDY